jgi:hypothetical protein
MLYPSICCRFRFFEGLWFCRFRPEVVSSAWGCGKPELTSPFDLSTQFCISGLLTCLVYLFPFKGYSTFLFWLEIPIGAEILGVLGNCRLLSACVHRRDPQKAPPCVKLRRLSHHTCLCDAPFDRYANARKSLLKK